MRVQRPDTRSVLRSPGELATQVKAPRPTAPLHATRVLAVLLAISAAGDVAAAALQADMPAAGREVTAIESVPPAEPGRQRAVFVCREGGAPVFADRPCGPALRARTLAIDAPAPGAVSSTTPPAPRAITRPRPQPDGRAGTGRTAETRCTTLQRQLADLDDRMRAGYSSREAARLWNRWRELKGRLQTERC